MTGTGTPTMSLLGIRTTVVSSLDAKRLADPFDKPRSSKVCGLWTETARTDGSELVKVTSPPFAKSGTPLESKMVAVTVRLCPALTDRGPEGLKEISWTTGNRRSGKLQLDKSGTEIVRCVSSNP